MASRRARSASDCGDNSEVFPFFREFWIETPQAGSNRATIYALLDSEAATGAFRFDLATGQESVIDVQATLFARRPVSKFGLAPLTSMYLTGENDRRMRDGFRSELHDSDGLLIHGKSKEWLWRPLGNPPQRAADLLRRSEYSRLRADAARPQFRDLSGHRARL